MKLTKTLPNYIYISASLILFTFFAAKALYLREASITSVICFAVVTFISTVAAVFIKNYKSEESSVGEILEATTIPGLLFALYSMLIDKRAVYFLIIAIVIGTVAYISVLIKINIIDSKRNLKSQYAKEVVAIGLFNARSFFLLAISVFILFGSLMIVSNAIYEERLERQNKLEKFVSEQNLVEWSESRTLAANYEEMAPLATNEEFEKVRALDERLALSARVVDIESNYLGIPNRISVVKDDLKEGISAYYSAPRKMIVIDEEFLTSCSRDDLIRTCIHECTHALQAEKKQLYRELKDNRKAMILLSDYFGDIEKYEELSSYEGEADEYYNQIAELEAITIKNSDRRLREWDNAFQKIALEKNAERTDS